ncbi:hypothetical protein [Paenibacillus kyungheensis]
MDQLPTRIHLGKAIRKISRSLIRFPQNELFSLASEPFFLLSKQEINTISAELYWFRLTALQVAVLIHIQQRHYNLNMYEARYMMTTAIELAFQDADLSRTDTIKIRSKLSEEMDYYFNRLDLSNSSDHISTVADLLRSFADRTLLLCTSVQLEHHQDQREQVLVQEATVIWDKVTHELEELLRNIKIIEFEQ